MASEGTPNGNIYLEIMKKKIKDFFPEEGARISLSFIPQPSDMIVTTALKCGTTWMQQIVHQLRSGGGMDYEDISDVVPYIDLSHTCEVDLEAEQRYQPR